MVLLSKEEIEREIRAVKDCIQAHEAGLKLSADGIKVNSFLLQLLEKELEKFKK